MMVEVYMDLLQPTFLSQIIDVGVANGDLHYLEENTAVYRVSGTSISNNKNLEKKIKFASIWIYRFSMQAMTF